jgi:hypothetical protein
MMLDYIWDAAQSVSKTNRREKAYNYTEIMLRFTTPLDPSKEGDTTPAHGFVSSVPSTLQ